MVPACVYQQLKVNLSVILLSLQPNILQWEDGTLSSLPWRRISAWLTGSAMIQWNSGSFIRKIEDNTLQNYKKGGLKHYV